MPETGQKAPAFKLPDENGNMHTNSEYLGRRLLVYFYPKDFTSGCTKEACSLRDNFEKLREKVEIVGISRDSISSHKKFKDKYSLPFTLLSDSNGEVIKKYGTNGLILPKRTSFLISPEGIIEKIYRKVNPQIHATEILKDVTS